MIASKFLGRQVLLTCAALFILGFSLNAFWYNMDYRIAGDNWIDSGGRMYAVGFYTENTSSTELATHNIWETHTTYSYAQNSDPIGPLLGTMQSGAVIWFLIAMLFLGLCLLDQRLLSIFAGLLLVVVSLAPVLYFVLMAPVAVSSNFEVTGLQIPGFMGTDSNAAGSYVTTGPLIGFWLASFACALQIVAVALRSYAVVSIFRKDMKLELNQADSTAAQEDAPEKSE